MQPIYALIKQSGLLPNVRVGEYRWVTGMGVAKAIEDDLASQYLLGFYPGGTTVDRVHRIDVQLTRNNRRLRVKTLREEYSLKQKS